MLWTPVAANGEFIISDGKTPSGIGTVLLDTAGGSGTVTLGLHDRDGVFHAFADGLMASTSAYVRHGIREILVASVTGNTGAWRIGYTSGHND